jgi:hypothetical protein
MLLSVPLALLATLLWAKTEAFEIGSTMSTSCPAVEADGIAGDFIRNDRIVAVISGNLPTRKANMATFGEAITPGCIYDLCPAAAAMISSPLWPGRQAGPLSRSASSKPARIWEAVVRAELTDAGNGLGKTRLHPARRLSHIVVVSTYHNASRQACSVGPPLSHRPDACRTVRASPGECRTRPTAWDMPSPHCPTRLSRSANRDPARRAATQRRSPRGR